MMFTIKIADIHVRIRNRYSYTKALCSEYVIEENAVDLEVEASEEDIAEEIKTADTEVDAAYAESVCLHREIAERLWRHDCFLLHSAVIECEGQGYAFAAASGVGKTTHISLWEKNFGDCVSVINGDKPIIRIGEKGILAYGTPWNGKEGRGENRFSPLRAVCFIERGKENKIVPISGEEVIFRLFSQVYLPKDAEGAAKTLDLLDTFVRKVSFFRLSCNMEDEAALVAREAMTQ